MSVILLVDARVSLSFKRLSNLNPIAAPAIQCTRFLEGKRKMKQDPWGAGEQTWCFYKVSGVWFYSYKGKLLETEHENLQKANGRGLNWDNWSSQ